MNYFKIGFTTHICYNIEVLGLKEQDNEVLQLKLLDS